MRKPRFSNSRNETDATPLPTKEEKSDISLAKAIKRISLAMDELTKTGLNRDAVVVLLAEDTGIGKRTLNKVFDSLNELATRYTT